MDSAQKEEISLKILRELLQYRRRFPGDDTSIADFIGGAQLGIASGLALMAAGMADAVHSAQAEEGAAHLHSGSLACLCPLVFHVPVAVVWVFGDPWVPWIVLVTLFAYVVANIVLQAMGTRRITALVETDSSQITGFMTVAKPSSTGATA